MTDLALSAAPSGGQFQLRLGLVFALAISVGNIIGSGIMRTPGLVADQVPVAMRVSKGGTPHISLAITAAVVVRWSASSILAY